MRAWAEPVYGIPPEQVMGSSIKTHYEIRDGRPAWSSWKPEQLDWEPKAPHDAAKQIASEYRSDSAADQVSYSLFVDPSWITR